MACLNQNRMTYVDKGAVLPRLVKRDSHVHILWDFNVFRILPHLERNARDDTEEKREERND